MEYFKYFTDALSKYTEFKGRATRTQFWMYILIFLIIVVILGLFSSWLAFVFALALLSPSLAIGTRRLHDIDRPGLWQLLWLVLGIGWIVLVIFFAQPSDGDNDYGPAAQAS